MAMENKAQQGTDTPENDAETLNAGSDPTGNSIEDIRRQTEPIPNNQGGKRSSGDNPDEANKPAGGRTFKETTDPGKLSDI